MSAGATTSRGHAQPRRLLPFARQPRPSRASSDFKLGNGLFRKSWVSSPSSTQASDGLGPLFNARACQECHLKDGRGNPPAARTTVPCRCSSASRCRRTTDAEREALATKAMLRIPEPTYGGQLQNFGVPGIAAEGEMQIAYEEVPVALERRRDRDAPQAHLLGRRASATVRWPTDVMLSPRVAPPMIGVGLLEQIHPGDILANADPDDADGDGISGRPSMVRDPDDRRTRRSAASAGRRRRPTSAAQSADAFSGDIGISTPPVTAALRRLHRRRRRPAATRRAACRRGSARSRRRTRSSTSSPSTAATSPSRPGATSTIREVLAGKALFYEFGCASCHRPKYVTRRDAPQPEHRFQLIWPYTDLLLHDMGEGLADDAPVGDAVRHANGARRRFGVSVSTETVNGHTFFLHDGRARNLLEAVLWHGGEAEAARDGSSLPRRRSGRRCSGSWSCFDDRPLLAVSLSSRSRCRRRGVGAGLPTRKAAAPPGAAGDRVQAAGRRSALDAVILPGYQRARDTRRRGSDARQRSLLAGRRETARGGSRPASATSCSPGRGSNSSASVRRATTTATSGCSSGPTRAAAACSRSRRSSPPRTRRRPRSPRCATKSVAVQGLFALEFVLYGTGSEVLTDAGRPGSDRSAAASAPRSPVRSPRPRRRFWPTGPGRTATPS